VGQELSKAEENKPSILDANPDIYANPPPLTQTLFAGSGSGDAVTQDDKGPLSSTTLGAAVGVFALVAVFLFIEFSSGGGGLPSPSVSVRPLVAPSLYFPLLLFRSCEVLGQMAGAQPPPSGIGTHWHRRPVVFLNVLEKKYTYVFYKTVSRY
jgi:hypothetical protein